MNIERLAEVEHPERANDPASPVWRFWHFMYGSNRMEQLPMTIGQSVRWTGIMMFTDHPLSYLYGRGKRLR